MQKLFNIVLGLAVMLLAAGVAALWLDRPTPAPDAETIRVIVAETLESRTSAANDEPTEVGTAIEEYLVANPRVLQRAAEALETELAAEEAEVMRSALAELEDAIYNDPDNVVLGNPDGAVTLVELFDYNCTYCRQVVPDVLELIAENPDLRVILKEFPILSNESLEAARVGLVVNDNDVDYALYHATLMSARGTVDAQGALDAAASLGLEREEVASAMESTEVTGAIERTYAIARTLGITGTPTFIIGNAVMPGALRKEDLETYIANMRACGEAECPGETG